MVLTSKKNTLIAFLYLAISQFGCSVFGIRYVEMAEYNVMVEEDDMEIRDYSPRIIAKTTVSGEYKEAQEAAFGILADYIFGNNTEKDKIAMTAPVTQTKKPVKIDMTAPVTQEKTGDGWSMSFAMPAKYKSLSQLPKPMDNRIELVEKPRALYAAIGFTWLTNEEKNNQKTKELLNWLKEKKKYRPVSTPFYAGYDPPWTIPFLRRQEILVEIEAYPKK